MEKIYVLYEIFEGVDEYSKEIIKAYKRKEVAEAYANYKKVCNNKDYISYEIEEIEIDNQ